MTDLDEEETAPEGYTIPDDLLPAPISRTETGFPDAPKLPWQVPIVPTPLPVHVDEGTALVDHINDDLAIYNTMLENCRNQWKGPTITCLDDFCKLSLTTMRLIEGRRRAANKPLGADSKGGSRKDDPIEI